MKQTKILFVVLFIVLITILVPFFFLKFQHKKNNSISAVKESRISLGRYLYYDRRLSINFVKSCGTCHNQKLAFSDGYKRSMGAFADIHQRNTSVVFNLASYKYLTQSDSTFHNAFDQMKNPLYNQTPIEMGLTGNEKKILDRIKKDNQYVKMFSSAFPDSSNSITWTNIRIAISEFMYTIVSDKSDYDKYKKGDTNALTASQKSGMKLFFSDKLKCAKCHGGFNFSTPEITNSKGDTMYYFNVGLYNVDGKGSYPDYDQGLFQLTKNPADMGAFRVPTLRNIAYTAPYFHDGSCESLAEVMDVFARGGKKIEQGLYDGDGTKNKYKHAYISGFEITETEKIDVINFLYSLSDSALITNPAYSNPFGEDETKKTY